MAKVQKQVTGPKSRCQQVVPESTQPPRLGQTRKLGFRLAAALVIPCLSLCFLEGALRLAGYGFSTSFFVPYKVQGRQAYVANERFGWRFFDPGMARTPEPAVLSTPKPPGTFRIFVLGESAAFGDPQPDFGLPRMLRVLLSKRYPGTRFEVVNAAMTAVNSHVLLPVARDCSRREGDLWVVYMGNNEVVGPFGSGTVFSRRAPSLALIRSSIALKSTRTGEVLGDLVRRLSGRPAGRAEWGGMAMFLDNKVRQDDPRMVVTYAQFERNLRDILETGLGSHARIIVSTVASNLKDCAPFASEHKPGLTEAQLADWERRYRSGVERYQAGDDLKAIECFQDAAKIDDGFAEMQFFWGSCCLRLKRAEEARTHLRLARDYDALRFRADSRINDVIRRVCAGRRSQDILLCDGEQILGDQSPDGLPGRELLYDHVHPTFQGNYLLALGIAEGIDRMLPPEIARQAQAAPAWPSLEECARQLAWTDWNRYEGAAAMMRRMSDPPFTSQTTHAEQLNALRAEMEKLSPAVDAQSLDRYLARYRQALQLATNDWVLYKNLALLQQKRGDLAGAADSWRQVTLLLPHNGEARTALALVMIKLDQPEKAIPELRIALAVTPDHVSGAALNAYGLALAAEKRFGEAVRYYERALKLSPESTETHLNLAAALDALGKRDEARQHLRATLERKPNNPGALVELGKMCVSRGWIAEALTNFNQALALEPTDSTAHFCLGGALSMLRRWPEAKSHYAEAVRLRPDFTEARLGLGIELGREGQHQQALEQFAEAVRLGPRLIEARLNLGIALSKAQRQEEAVAQFQKVLEIDPGNALAEKYLQQLTPGK